MTEALQKLSPEQSHRVREQVRSSEVAGQTTVEQRRTAYGDVRELLVNGFIAESLTYGNISLSLRSLVRSDFFLLRHRCGGSLNHPDFPYWMLAQSVWMLDGQLLLEDPQATWEVFQKIRGSLPKVMRAHLFATLTEFQTRIESALHLVQGFVFEQESRLMWSGYGEKLAERSGIPGAERLGLNHVQEAWIAYNSVEDAREGFLQQWTTAKLVASSMAPKGIRKLNAQDESAARTLKAERQRAMDLAYFAWIGRKDLVEQRQNDRHVSGVRVALTEEELQDEFRRWRLGIKDDHDRIVDAYKERIRQKIEQEKADKEDRIRRAQAQLEAEGIDEPALRPLLVRPEEIGQKFGHRTKYFSTPKGNYLYDRYLKPQTVPGRLSMTQGKPTAMPDMTLQEQVAARKPTTGE